MQVYYRHYAIFWNKSNDNNNTKEVRLSRDIGLNF